ncbi:heat shock 70 kDa protein 12A-like [Mercenaria mercenaria]|uniref:heat shock 70 kDa protein 12A-like n=1 Tax=Mercenaria mercenaria TaxID=6596 RepID=UPI00234F4EC2|nr:heat shock 70 kDa protein 12A-like [Mercenaria mercenaria]
MKFGVEVFRTLFDESLSKTIQHIEKLLRDLAVSDLRAILMVGGFSDSPMLQEKVKFSFPNIDVIIPAEASYSILRGALIFGHSPKAISERVLKYTYGVEMLTPFIKGRHPESKRVMMDSGPKCKHVFHKHVERNQVVKVGDAQVTQSYHPVNWDQTAISFPVYASELKDPQYTDVGCKYVGEMLVNLPDHDGDFSREVKLSLTFSGTEIEVIGVDEKTGEETKASINFLG